jgi:hypothetical protein
MLDEKNLKFEGDELARICVESGMGVDQLRKIYQLVRVRPLLDVKSLEYVQVYVQRQMTRVRGRAGFKKVLELIDKYGSVRKELEKILMFALMLYGFHREKPVLDLLEVAEPVIREVIERHGAEYRETKIKLRGNLAVVAVKTWSFRSNRGVAANEIRHALKSKSEFSNLDVKVWIEPR